MNLLRKPFRYAYGNAVFVIIGINILVFLCQNLFYAADALLCLNVRAVLEGGAYWQFLTYMFAHGGITHLLLNMLGLFMFGSEVERRMGTKEFLLYYLLTGVLAGVFSFFVYWITGADYVMLLGASGALFAVMLAYATFFPESVIYIWGLLPVRAPVMVIGYTAIELVASFVDMSSGVAHLTHLAGFGFAYLYFLGRFGANPWRYLFGRR